MNKPQKETKTYYDYHKCRDYLQKKYKYDERDYAGRYKHRGEKIVSMNEEKPYLDFWHWVCDNYSVHNGCFITFYKDVLEDLNKDDEKWMKEIYTHYIEEFADDSGELEMYVWW